MKVAAIVPTRDRPATLQRALQSFFWACESAALEVAVVVVSDDSASCVGRQRTRELVRRMAAARGSTLFCLMAGGVRARSPGTARNRGLHCLLEAGVPHDAVVMFDDDVSFADCAYQNQQFRSDGASLMCEVAQLPRSPHTVLGCCYRGRQDLALLDHIRLADVRATEPSPSIERADVPNEAPGGVTGAFLSVPRSVQHLPHFLAVYNEDYFWLRRMAREGWRLYCSPSALVHAPPGKLEISRSRLIFEMRGEVLWCAALDICRDPSLGELLQRLYLSITDRIRELEAVSQSLADGVFGRGFDRARSILPTASSDLLRLRRSVECASGAHRPPIVDELKRIAAYCGR